MTTTAVLTSIGAAVGAGSQPLLSRLHRGATVHKGWLAAGVATLWALAGWRVSTGHLPWWWLPIPLSVAWLAVLLTAVDMKHRRLPNALTLPAYPLTAATVAVATTHSTSETAKGALLGATTLGGVYLTAHLLSPTSMGAGDVKLSGTQGAVMGAVGLPAVLLGTTLAALLTLLLAATTPKRVRQRWKSGIPHGPALLTATYVIATFPTIHPP